MYQTQVGLLGNRWQRSMRRESEKPSIGLLCAFKLPTPEVAHHPLDELPLWIARAQKRRTAGDEAIRD